MAMSCTVAVSNSPVFSPSSVVSSSLFCKASFPPPLSRVSSSPSFNSPAASSPSSSSVSLNLATSGFRPTACAVTDDAPSTSNCPPSPVLKRKRPTRLDIPVVSYGFEAATPRAEELVVEAETPGVYSVCCKRGRRSALEDRYSAVLNIQDDPKQAFFGIFDGHGGAKAAEFAAANIDKNIMNELIRLDDGGDVKEAVKQGYLKTDSDFLKEDIRGGSCCVTAFVRNGSLVVSNAGDCRAVMSRGGVAEALTTDHRPSRGDEKDRIEAVGGYIDCYHGVWRIQGSLAVSRGIGDGHLKQWVIADPETEVRLIKPETEFLILASDGLWDKVTNQEAVDIARPLCVGTSKPEPLAACKKLIQTSASRGSGDDISVMVIQLGQFMVL